MSSVTAYVSDPFARRLETRESEWVVSGLAPDRVADRIDADTSFDEAVERARSLPGEYTLLRIGGGDPAVEAFRGIGSWFDVYCWRPPDGGLVVGDHVRDVTAAIPVAERTVAPSVPTDQLLLGTRPNDTYLENVDRLGHGERLTWSPGTAPDTALVDSPTLTPTDTLDPTTAIEAIDGDLRRTAGAEFPEPVATMLSGGVDSTLVHTYRDGDPTVAGAVDSPEFEFEVEYARRASDLLGSDHETVHVEEDDYLDHLAATIEAAGQPVLLPQATLMHRCFTDTDYRTFLNGGLADGLFGTGGAAIASLARLVGPLHPLVPDLTWETTAVRETAEQL